MCRWFLWILGILVLGAGCIGQGETTTVAVPLTGAMRVEVCAHTRGDETRTFVSRYDWGRDAILLSGVSAAVFWMVEMRVPLDAVWVNDGRVTSTQRNIPIRDEMGQWTRFASGEPVDALLELSAGALAEEPLLDGAAIPDVPRACR